MRDSYILAEIIPKIKHIEGCPHVDGRVPMNEDGCLCYERGLLRAGYAHAEEHARLSNDTIDGGLDLLAAIRKQGKK